MDELIKHLESELDSARWEWIKPHLERGSVIVVDRMLSMPQIGASIASDDVEAIKALLASGMIFKPSPEQVETWGINKEKRFSVLIIEPFVLVQEQGEPETCLYSA